MPNGGRVEQMSEGLAAELAPGTRMTAHVTQVHRNIWPLLSAGTAWHQQWGRGHRSGHSLCHALSVYLDFLYLLKEMPMFIHRVIVKVCLPCSSCCPPG